MSKEKKKAKGSKEKELSDYQKGKDTVSKDVPTLTSKLSGKSKK